VEAWSPFGQELVMTDTLTQVVRAARDAAALLPPPTVPRPFDSWQEMRAVYDSVEKPLVELLRDRLEVARPGVPWADELDTDLPTGDCWVVDAIDGAVHYLQGLPQWSVSIALVRDGRPVLAVLHSATFGHTYTATDGGGASLDGNPVTPSAKTDLALALVAGSHPPFVASQPLAVADTARATARLLPAVGVLRNLGPTSWQVADVASGRIDAFVEHGTDAGNLLAASLVATEAGVTVTDVAGNPWHAGSTSFLAAPAALHTQLLDLLAGPVPAG
jgi:myo-inositol-1(or 4)-monophosphatase